LSISRCANRHSLQNKATVKDFAFDFINSKNRTCINPSRAAWCGVDGRLPFTDVVPRADPRCVEVLFGPFTGHESWQPLSGYLIRSLHTR
jgi:hypothetical protein